MIENSKRKYPAYFQNFSLDTWECESDLAAAQRQLKDLMAIEQNIVQIKILSSVPNLHPLKQVELLNKLPLSLCATSHRPPINGQLGNKFTYY